MIERSSAYEERTAYEKDGEKSYLILKSGEELSVPYQLNMLKYNQIPGLLPVRFFIQDGEYRYFYDITSRETLAVRMRDRKYNIKEIRTIMTDLYACVQRMEEYLLDPRCLILEPAYLYTEKNHLHIQFCFYPDKKESLEQSLENLFAYFMNHLDYEDEKTVVLVYSLYHKAREAQVPLQEFMQQFCEVGISDDKGQMQETSKSCHPEMSSVPETGEEKRSTEWAQEKKKLHLEKWFPYVPDLIGGYALARILIYLIQNHTAMSRIRLAECILLLVGMICLCGSVSMWLSELAAKKNLKGIQPDTAKKKNMGPEKTSISENNMTIKTKNAYPWERKSEIQKSVPKQNGMKTANNMQKAEKVPQDYEEIRIADEQEIQPNQEPKRETKQEAFSAWSIPATVVMKEPEVFHAFNPVLVSKDKMQFQDIILKKQEMLIGKIQGMTDVCLEAESISRLHALIKQDTQGCCVIDQGSTNGTYVNGQRLVQRQPVYLKEGDEIRFAQAIYEFKNVRSQ